MAGDNHALKIIYDHLVSHKIKFMMHASRSFIINGNEQSENKDKID